jgi:predicted dehydrogenase
MRKRLYLFLVMCLPALAQEQYKIAVVGLVHSHVWGHLGTMLKGGPARLVGVSDPHPDLIAEVKKEASKAGVAEPKFYDDYKQMLDTEKPDIVWAFVENNRHLEIVQACAPRKINVIFEKPLASTYKDARTIQELANKSSIRVMVNYQMAWWPTQYTAKAVADSGDLGKVYRLRGIVGHGGPGSEGARNKYFFEWLTDPVKNGAGALMDFGCYNALWALWYLGRPDTVYATVAHIQPERFPKVEDNATIVLGYPAGVGLFEGSWDLPRGFQDLEVFGRKGSVYVTNREVKKQAGGAPVDVKPEPLSGAAAEPIAFMMDAIRNNKRIEGLTSLELNIQVNEIIDAAKESVRTGKAVHLGPAKST